MSYNLKELSVMDKKELADKIMNSMMTVVEPFELIDLYNTYWGSKPDRYEILPNEIEYLNDFFEEDSPAYVLSCLSRDKLLYRYLDNYFTMVDGTLLSFTDNTLKTFLKDQGYIDALATEVIEDEKDWGIDAIANIFKMYSVEH